MPALAGRQLIEFAAGASTKNLTVSGNALPVYYPATPTVAVSGAEISLSSVLIVDNTAATISKAVSTSTGTIKASAGTLYSWLCSTSGDIAIKDGTTEIARVPVLTGVATSLGPWGMPFATSITVSASAAVVTYVYK